MAVAMVIVGAVLSHRLPPQATDAPAPTADGDAARRPRTPSLSGAGSVTLAADAAGHFHAEAEIEGQTIPMLVDTGATTVALTERDASRIGMAPMPSDYKVRVSTANGIAAGAPIRLREIRVGGLVARDVPAMVMPAGLLAQSLLGMSFLNMLGHVEMGSRQLVLRQ